MVSTACGKYLQNVLHQILDFVMVEWVLNNAGVKRALLDSVKARKLACYGHTMRKQGSCLEKEIMQGTVAGSRR